MRTSRSRRRLGATAIGVALALALTACQWSMPRFSASGTGHNTSESHLGLDNIGSLALTSTAVVPGTSYGTVPVVNGNRAYVTSSGVGGVLATYDLSGAGCPGTPGVCPPLWTSAFTGDVGQATVYGGLVYVQADYDLHAYDAQGVNGCSATPKVCTPVWTAPGWGGTSVASGGRLFVSSFGRLGSFDPAGVAGCTGAPATCTPAWSFTPTDSGADALSLPAVAGGMVYVGVQIHGWVTNDGASGHLVALDADGCGAPTCTPSWRSATTGSSGGSPAVANGAVYVLGSYTYELIDPEWGEYTTGHDVLRSFDIATCGATPPGSECAATWSARTQTGDGGYAGSVAVADGLVHASWEDPVLGQSIATFPADGGSSCGGPLGCVPARLSPTAGAFADLVVANGVLYAGHTAYDASGATGCSGTPAVCTATWTAPAPVASLRKSVVSDGMLIGIEVTGGTQRLRVLRTP